jgi:site-specific DNA recombinase
LRNGLEVIKSYELAESSTVGDRKQFNEAILFARKQKQPTAIVTDKVDRFQRRFKESVLVEEFIQKGKIELHFHVEGLQIHQNSTSQERLMWNMHVVMAQSYVDSLRDNVNRSIEEKLLGGEWVSTAPIGYRHIKGPRRQGKIVLDELRAPLVKRLFTEYSTGEFTMEDMRRRTKEWRLTNSRGNQGYLSKSHINEILQNPFYYGVMRLRKTGEKFPHKYERIIEKDLFDRCEAVRKGWNKKPFKYGGKEYIFRGMIQCTITGRTCSSDTKKLKRVDGTPYELTYLGTANPADTKKKVWVREDAILEEVEGVFERMRLGPDTLAQVVQYIKAGASAERDFHKSQMTELFKEKTSIQNKLEKLMDFWLEDKIAEEEYHAKRGKLLDRRELVNRDIASHDDADDSFNNTLIELVKLSDNAAEFFKLSSVEGKRRLVNLVFSKVELRGKKLEYALRPPFDQFVDVAEIGEWRTREDSNSRPLDS